MIDFYKVEVTNSWEHLTYTVNGVKLVEVDGRCDVRFPDGVISNVKYTATFRTIHYSDQGHDYPVRQFHPMLNLTILGESVRVPMAGKMIGNLKQGPGVLRGTPGKGGRP